MDDSLFYSLLLLMPLFALALLSWGLLKATKECCRCACRIPKNAKVCVKCGAEQTASQ